MTLKNHLLLAVAITGAVFALVLVATTSSAVAFGAAGTVFILYWVWLFSSQAR